MLPANWKKRILSKKVSHNPLLPWRITEIHLKHLTSRHIFKENFNYCKQNQMANFTRNGGRTS